MNYAVGRVKGDIKARSLPFLRITKVGGCVPAITLWIPQGEPYRRCNSMSCGQTRNSGLWVGWSESTELDSLITVRSRATQPSLPGREPEVVADGSG